MSFRPENSDYQPDSCGPCAPSNLGFRRLPGSAGKPQHHQAHPFDTIYTETASDLTGKGSVSWHQHSLRCHQKSRLLPELLTYGYILKVPTTLSSGPISLLDWLTDSEKYLLKCSPVYYEGYCKRYGWAARWKGRRERSRSSRAGASVPKSWGVLPCRHVGVSHRVGSNEICPLKFLWKLHYIHTVD